MDVDLLGGSGNGVSLAVPSEAKRALRTVSRVSQRGGGCEEAAEFRPGGIGQEGKNEDAGPLRKLAHVRGESVANDGASLIETARPAGPVRTAHDEEVGMDAGRDQHGPRNFKKVGPMRDNSNESAFERGQPGIKAGIGGANLQGDELDARWQNGPHRVRFAGTA